jgi:hypothetical protein
MRKSIVVLALLASVSATAQAAHRKTAFIVVNWGAPAFGSEAEAVQTQLMRLGWDAYLFQNYSSDGVTIPFDLNGQRQSYVCQTGVAYCGWQEIMTSFLPAASIQSGDQVLIDIQGDGTTNFAQGLVLADGQALGVGGSSTDIDSSLAYEEFATSFRYSSVSAEIWATHSVEAFLQGSSTMHTGSDFLGNSYGSYYPNMIASGDALQLSQLYSGKGAKVTVIDHSCQGGSTTKLLEGAGESVCGISTTGIDSPGIQGTPPLSAFLAKLKPGDKRPMSDVASYISDYLASNFQNVGQRMHQLGFSTGCTETMAARETSDNAAGAYSTWWDWSRNRPSHVVRVPSRYATPASASPNPPWTAAMLDSSFTKDCTQAKKNCDITSNPRLRVAQGWVRWFQESLEDVKNNRRFGEAVALTQGQDEATKDLARLLSDGDKLVERIDDYRTLVDELDASLGSSLNEASYYGAPKGSPDTYLRSVFTQRCLCGDSAVVAQWKLACPAKPADRYPLPKDWSESKVCSDPTGFVTAVLSPIGEKKGSDGKLVLAPLEVLKRIEAYETGTGPTGLGSMGTLLMQFEQDLQPFEKTCVSSACHSQEI